jgi:hypothetical protein
VVSVLNTKALFQQLLLTAPEFRLAYEEHLTDNGEVLPHVLMADFARFFLDTWRISRSSAASSDHARQVVRECLALLEQGLASPDEDLQNVISVSFLEYLEWAGQAGQAGQDYNLIKRELGPELQRQLRVIEEWMPGATGKNDNL